jgi:site-specific DNA recombinase
MGTGWLMQARTRTGYTRHGDGGAAGWTPTPETAPVVRWIFAQRLAGHSLARITRALNDTGIPCPSAADPGRNTHRPGLAWSLTTVRAILANPRYTGRQVRNRQATAMTT